MSFFFVLNRSHARDIVLFLQCDGVAAECPVDGVRVANTVCRSARDLCDAEGTKKQYDDVIQFC